MEKKQLFFIYGRKELFILVLLGLMVALFAFTLGVHLGKKVSQQAFEEVEKGTETVSTEKDHVPNRQEILQHSREQTDSGEDTMDRILHEEVAKTGIKLDVPKQIDLPDQPKSKNAGATTLEPVEEKVAPKIEKKVQKKIASPAPPKKILPPSGKYTIQVGSHPSSKEASGQLKTLEKHGIKAFIREAEIKGKGTWYRVYLGGYPNRKEALKQGNDFKKKKVIQSFIVSNMPQN